jgi:hypothetical protein
MRLISARSALGVLSCALLWSSLWLCALEPGSAQAANDPRLSWWTLDTPHFQLHFHDGLEPMARLAAQYAEEAHAVLVPLLDWAPGAKTQIFLSDQLDSANGAASVIPYNRILLLGAAPDPRSTLHDHQGWLRNLIYHEYTHILHLDTMSGVSWGYNWFAGKSLAPNGALPKWYIEGLATYYESSHTSGGRVRSSQFAMALRVAALTHTLLGLDRLNGSPIDWPQARSWYLYGSVFIAWMAELHGESQMTAFNHAYGARLIPYAMNMMMLRLVGQDFPTLYARWQRHLEGESLGHWVSSLQRHGPSTPVEMVTHLGLESDHLRRRPWHREVSYFRLDGHSQAALMLLDLDTGRASRIFEHYGDGRHAWSSDGRWMVFAEIDPEDTVYFFFNLFRYDLDTGRKTQLTHGRLRAREPALSPDDRWLYFVSARQGTTDLMRLDMGSGAQEVLYRGQGAEQLSTPHVSPDGTQLVISRLVDSPGKPRRDLFLFDIASAEWSQLTNDDAIDLEPQFDAAGEHVLYSSDLDGVFCIYAFDLRTGARRQVSKTITGHFSPQLDPDGRTLYTVQYGALGYDVVMATLPAPLADLPTLPDGVTSYARPVLDHTLPPVEATLTPYAPWRYLWPRTWLPALNTLVGSQQQYNLLLAGADPVGLHAWLANISYNTASDVPGFTYNHVYSRLPFDLQGRISRFDVPRRLRAESRDFLYREESWSGGLDLSWSLPDQDMSHTLFSSYTVNRLALGEPINPNHSPIDRSPAYPELGYFNDLAVGWAFSSVDSFTYSISPELGFRLGLTVRTRGPWLGSDYKSLDASYSATVYLPVPWPWRWLDHHVLALRLGGGLGVGNFNRRGVFAIGGLPEQDLLMSILNQISVGGVHLRGYEPAATIGDQFHLLNVEYRFPLYDVESGAYTLPFYLGRLSGAVLLDYGGAFFGRFELDKLRMGIGGELRLNGTTAYYLPLSLRLGYAYGLDEDGIHQVYLVVGQAF